MKARTVVSGWLLAVAIAAAAQAAGKPQSAEPAGSPAMSARGQAPYTLQVNFRVVLTDVVVTDKHGNPVTGLTRSDFRIMDNGKAQTLASFEEHREQTSPPEAPSARLPASFSNDYLRHPPAQVNVLLFDTTTIGIIDQMILFQQMKKFVATLPAGEPVAVFMRSAGMTLQLAGFTDDHEALMAAIGRAIPKLPPPGAWMASDLDTLQQMAGYLSQVPGRKNLIWFTGGSNLFLQPDPTTIPDYQARRAIYDLLEEERIAIDPIDVRGLTITFRGAMAMQQMQMREDAAATGGLAFVNTNGLALATQHIVATDGNYYTLTYAPDDLKINNQWHRVEVKLDRRDCQLSYRHGYFDDGSKEPERTGKTITVLKAGGEKVVVPNDRSDPLVFDVQITPAPPTATPAANDPPLKRGQTRYVVEYDVPPREVYAANIHGNVGTDELGTAVLAFDQNGESVARRMMKVTVGVDERKANSLPNAGLIFTLTVNLPQGHNYLYLGLWDMMTRRMGIVNAEVQVPKAGKQPAASRAER